MNRVSPLHPHEPDIPPALDAEGRCLVCRIELERDRYHKALHQIAWRLHLALGEGFSEDDIQDILEHLDAGLPFGAPE